MSTTMLIILIILLFLSAFFSSAETAFTTVNRIAIRTLIEKGNTRAIIVDKIINNQNKMLSAILIGNNLVNIIASALATVLAQNLFGHITGLCKDYLFFNDFSDSTYFNNK